MRHKNNNYVVTKNDVKVFCHYTRDLNKIHNSDMVERYDRKAVIPAMYFLFKNIVSIEKEVQFKRISLFSESVCSADDKIEMFNYCNKFHNFFLEYKVKDFDNNKTNKTGLSQILHLSYLHEDLFLKTKHYDHEIIEQVNEMSLDGLEQLFKPKNNLLRTAYLMTNVSGIMQNAINNPSTEEEKTVYDLIKKNNLIPVYNEFVFLFPQGLSSSKANFAKYLIKFEDETPSKARSKKQKNILAEVNCDAEDISFSAFFNLRLIPEKILIKKFLEKL